MWSCYRVTAMRNYFIYQVNNIWCDLLIHYKRGMKKYSSYKLDFIAGEILNESKHDVSAKDIFKY